MRELIELLNQKTALLNDLLEYVSVSSFEESEEEVDNIVKYVEKKQEYINQLDKIEAKIKAFPKDNGDYMEVKAIEKKNDSLIRDIIGLDKINLDTMNSLRDKLKLNLKGTKIKQKYTVSYSSYISDIGGSRFDSKQ